jgi:hypothetical protein
MKKHNSLTLPPSTSAVRFRVLDVKGDMAQVEVGVDYSKAEIPSRAYYADFCDVVKDRLGYTLMFGKLIPGTTALRTKIEIAFPEEMFVRHLWASSRKFHLTVEKLAQSAKLVPLGKVQDTDKVQTFGSNNVLMAAWSQESVMDFYYVSPRDLQGMMTKTANTAYVEPVVRVVMGTALIYEFLEKCDAILPLEVRDAVSAETNP